MHPESSSLASTFSFVIIIPSLILPSVWGFGVLGFWGFGVLKLMTLLPNKDPEGNDGTT
jgi:hypothetical protein